MVATGAGGTIFSHSTNYYKKENGAGRREKRFSSISSSRLNVAKSSLNDLW